jgi:hypothetical protein
MSTPNKTNTDWHYIEWYASTRTGDGSWDNYARTILDRCGCQTCVDRRQEQGTVPSDREQVYVKRHGLVWMSTAE